MQTKLLKHETRKLKQRVFWGGGSGYLQWQTNNYCNQITITVIFANYWIFNTAYIGIVHAKLYSRRKEIMNNGKLCEKKA